MVIPFLFFGRAPAFNIHVSQAALSSAGSRYHPHKVLGSTAHAWCRG